MRLTSNQAQISALVNERSERNMTLADHWLFSGPFLTVRGEVDATYEAT